MSASHRHRAARPATVRARPSRWRASITSQQRLFDPLHAAGQRASRDAVSPSRASAGISSRRRERVKRGSRLDRIVGVSGSWPPSASRSAATSERRAADGPARDPCPPPPASSNRPCMPASPLTPLPRAMRNSTVSAWSSRVCAVSTCARADLARRPRPAGGSAPAARPPAGRSSACGRSSAACDARCRACRASRFDRLAPRASIPCAGRDRP